MSEQSSTTSAATSANWSAAADGETADVTLPTGFIRALAAATSRPQVLTTAAFWMPQIIEAERSSVSLPGLDDETLQIYSIAGDLIEEQDAALPIETSLVGEAFSKQRIAMLDDLRASPAAEAPRLVALGLRSALVCPMVIGGRSLGTINLGNSKPGFFTADHAELLRTIVDLIASFMAAHERADVERERARTDQLTGCASRLAILEYLDEAFQQEVKPSLLFVDVDGFKAINDRYGHGAGDDVLRLLASRISESLEQNSRLGRLGGDEFLIVVYEDRDIGKAKSIAAKIDERCGLPLHAGQARVEAKVSIGIAGCTTATTSSRDLLNEADLAMYAAKRSSTRIAVADEQIRSHAATIATIDRDIDDGMQDGDLTYHYQPIRDLASGEVLGAEALLRGKHPRLGALAPAVLLDRLQHTGLIDRFSEWSLRTVASDWSRVRAEIPWFHDKGVSINMSPQQLAADGCADLFMEAVEESGLRIADMIIEVVESTAIEDGDSAEQTLRRLGDAGAIIALDDFGAGRNALRYFTRFPIAAMKFDRSLVTATLTDPQASKILAGLTSMCHDLGIRSLAEGIETSELADICRDLGVGNGQGWYIGVPQTPEDFIATNLAEGPPARPWESSG